jgi:hypothetical protein
MQLSHYEPLVDRHGYAAFANAMFTIIGNQRKRGFVRFDDRLTTVLNGEPDSPRGRAVLWRQAVDLLAQEGHDLAEPVSERLLRLVALLAPALTATERADHAAAIASGCQFAPLIVLLANLDAQTGRSIMANAGLSEQAWLSIIPDIGPVGRNQLRRRDGLPARVQQALHLFAISDTALPAPDGMALADPRGESSIEIRDLVRRIEEYRQRREDGLRVHTAPVASASTQLRFVSDVAGRIVDIEHAPRGRFIGIDLSQPARPDEPGCDAGTARRIAKRGPIENGRVLLTGTDDWAGAWLVDAQPHFASENGSFLGYAGTLRRPTAAETAEPIAPPPTVEAISPDLVRQLVHELRSPLNAITGFAQMIEGQYAGPVASNYRTASRSIIADSAALLSAINEIDMLARGAGPITTPTEMNAGSVLGIIAHVVEQVGAGRPGGKAYFIVKPTDGIADLPLPADVDLPRILSLLLRPAATKCHSGHVGAKRRRYARTWLWLCGSAAASRTSWWADRNFERSIYSQPPGARSIVKSRGSGQLGIEA